MSYGGCWTAFGAVCWQPTWLMEAFGAAVGSQPCWNVFGAVGWQITDGIPILQNCHIAVAKIVGLVA
jgi:hypothetical protein